MLFFLKRTKIVLDCFTSNESCYKYSPISYASNFYPDWWKNTKKEYTKETSPHVNFSTIKNCTGIIEYYKKGVVMPFWTDLSIEVFNDQVNYEFADRLSEMRFHDFKQWKEMVSSEKKPSIFNCKIMSPWHFKTKENIYWVYQKPYWNHPVFDWFSTPSGILEFKYQHSTHYNFFINLENKNNCLLKHGSPIAHIIPISEKKIEIKNHLVDVKEFDSMKTPKISFTNNYKKIVTLTKKCPFGFGK